MKSVLPTLLFLFHVSFLFSQSEQTNTQWMLYLEELAESEDSEEGYIENLYNELSYLSEHPFNIQTVTKSDLEKLPFLAALQIENLLYYIYKYAPIVDIYELKNVEDLDRQTITYLLPFIYVGEEEEKVYAKPSLKNVLKYSKQEILLGGNFTVQEKAGYKEASKEEKELYPHRYYLGDPYHLSFRYNFSYQDKIQFGVSGEKDPGEAFWNEQQKGFDFYAMNLTLKNIGRIKTLSLGDYRLSFGEGLVLNNNFSMGKTSDVININHKNTGIKRHVSTNENQYFSGAAGTLKFDRLESSFFYSHRNLDANADSATIYSFKKDGYHRVPNDIAKKNNAEIDLYGTNLQWRSDYWSLGLTAIHYSFGGKELNPELKPYNLYTLRGKEHTNTGISYSYRQKKVLFQGETAIDGFGKLASINNLQINPASFVNWTLSYRYYAKDYNALYAKAFSESSTVQNETGLYTGMKIQFLRKWELAAYWDYFSFPWLKYEVDAPSFGNDILAQLSYRPTQNIQMNIRYKRKEKSKNIRLEDEHEVSVSPYEQHRLRYQLNYQLRPTILLKTQADYHLYESTNNKQNGWSLTQTVSYAPDKTKFQLDGAFAYFHSNNWNTRINIYEKNVLYAFSFPMYYGEGLRYYAVIKWKITNSFTLYFKAASTHYFDRNTISSGLEEIEGREKSDIYALFKYKF